MAVDLLADLVEHLLVKFLKIWSQILQAVVTQCLTRFDFSGYREGVSLAIWIIKEATNLPFYF